MGLFADEAQDSLSSLTELCRAFDDPAAVVEFKQIAHGLKGAAAALSLSELVAAIHRIEELAGDGSDAARTRLARALEVLGAIVTGLSVHGQLGQSELDVLAALVGSPPAPAAERPSAPAPVADVGLDRLTLPAREVDEALRLASAVARTSAALQDSLAGGEASVVRSGLELGASSDRLEALLLNFRMVPAAQALEGLAAEVTELAAGLGKDVRLALRGGEVRADRSTLQFTRTMIRHLVRNAVDHGLEPAAARLDAGKPSAGQLIVTTSVAGASLEVQVSDDGRGFDATAIRARLSSTAADPARIAALSDAEVLMRFAAAGGSTRAEATHVSGRGVGLSSVVSLVRSKGGDFRLDSEARRGSTVTFTVPLEVYSAEVLTVRTAGRLFGLPLSAVERTLRIGDGGVALQPGPAGPMLPIGEQILQLCELPATDAPPAAPRFAVVVRANQRRVALGVEELGETTRVSPQSVPPVVHPDALVTGVALLPSGEQLHVLSPHALLDAVRAWGRPAPAPAAPAEAAPAAPRRKLKVLLAEDSLATREVLRVLLEQEGYLVRVAGDGVEALEAVQRERPDVVVSDFNMPRCDGPGLARALRASPATARLPVVLLSSQADAKSKAIGAASGADAYLVKAQFNAALLRATLRRLGVEE